MILEYYKYDASSVKQLKNFIKRCRSYLKSDSNLLWVALQSNQLADTAFNVEADFKEELKTMKMDLKKSGWILPTLKTNMRNQINISKINVEGTPGYDMQTCIKKLKAETNLVGDIPIFIKVNYKSDWNKKKNTTYQPMEKIKVESELSWCYKTFIICAVASKGWNQYYTIICDFEPLNCLVFFSNSRINF